MRLTLQSGDVIFCVTNKLHTYTASITLCFVMELRHLHTTAENRKTDIAHKDSSNTFLFRTVMRLQPYI